VRRSEGEEKDMEKNQEGEGKEFQRPWPQRRMHRKDYAIVESEEEEDHDLESLSGVNEDEKDEETVWDDQDMVRKDLPPTFIGTSSVHGDMFYK
jgi:hypothetical protein